VDAALAGVEVCARYSLPYKNGKQRKTPGNLARNMHSSATSREDREEEESDLGRIAQKENENGSGL
jgi:hypothetical protein